MTEEEWNRHPPDGWRMLYHAEEIGSERKLRLFLIACCRRIEHLLIDTRSKTALAGIERHVEGHSTTTELGRLGDLAKEAADAAAPVPYDLEDELDPYPPTAAPDAIRYAASLNLTTALDNKPTALTNATYLACNAVGGSVFRRTNNVEQARAASAAEIAIHAVLLRDIFGNPFRPATFDPAWRTSTAVALARGMYESRDFTAMPILADALQDAGCDNDDILNHCRGPGPHVRGCWVVDLVLGKS
jgi:hypothetical protein